MNSALKWTLVIAAVGVAGFATAQGVNRTRRSVRRGLTEAERVADRTRQTVGQVQETLHQARTSI